MDKLRAFLKRKNIVFSAKRYFIDAMSAMAQGLFCTLLVGTILNTIGTQFNIGFLKAVILTVGSGEGAVSYTIGGLASAMVGPGMAVAIGSALQAPPLAAREGLLRSSSWPSLPQNSARPSARRPRWISLSPPSSPSLWAWVPPL